MGWPLAPRHAERAERQRVFDTRPLDAREAIKAVQTGDGRRDQNVTHDLLRQVMASKPYENRVPEVVDFVRTGFSALYPGNVPRDATGKAKETRARTDVSLGNLLDAMGVGSLSAAEAAGRRQRDRQEAEPPARDPFDVGGRHEDNARNIIEQDFGDVSHKELKDLVDDTVRHVNEGVAKKAKTLGYVPERVRTWVEDSLIAGDAEAALHAVDLLDRLHGTVPGYDDGIDKIALGIADRIRASRRGNLYGTAEEWVENARRPFVSEEGDPGQSSDPMLAVVERGEEILKELKDGGSVLAGRHLEAYANIVRGAAVMGLHQGEVPSETLLGMADQLDALREDWFSMELDEASSRLADLIEYATGTAVKGASGKDTRKGSRGKRKGGGGVPPMEALLTIVQAEGAMYQTAIDKGHTQENAVRLAHGVGAAVGVVSALRAIPVDNTNVGEVYDAVEENELARHAAATAIRAGLGPLGYDEDALLNEIVEFVLPKKKDPER